MTDQEYEQKKRECWEELHNELLDGEVQWQPVSRKEIVNFVFDRAYALGKHEKDAEDDRTLKVNRQLFCRLCADADDYINEHLEEEDGDYTYYQGRSDALHELYRGECKDAEGEEMLICDRDVVRMLYDGTDSVKVRQVLEGIFGSKCLPDDQSAKTAHCPSPDAENSDFPNLSKEPEEDLIPSNSGGGLKSQDADKQFNKTLNSSFRQHNRLYVAAKAMQGIVSNQDAIKYAITHFECPRGNRNRYFAVARYSLAYADALIAKAEKTSAQ